MKRFLFSILAWWFLAFVAGAQPSKIQVPCATMEMDSINRAKFPHRGRLEDFEDFIQQKINENIVVFVCVISRKKSATKTSAKTKME